MNRFIVVVAVIAGLSACAAKPTRVVQPELSGEAMINYGNHRIYARQQMGRGPALVMMHGFPDNHGIYDRLHGELSGRRLVVFDFVGWGRSDRPDDDQYDYSVASQIEEIDAVLDHFNISKAILVVHDMAGPPAIRYALQNPDRVVGLALLNTYFHESEARSSPFTLAAFSMPVIRSFVIPFARIDMIFSPVFRAQMRPFFAESQAGRDFGDRFVEQFVGERPVTKDAFFAMVGQFRSDLRSNGEMVPQLAEYPGRVAIVFGAEDPYLGADLAREFHGLFPRSTLHLLPQARHYPQIERAGDVAAILNKLAE